MILMKILVAFLWCPEHITGMENVSPISSHRQPIAGRRTPTLSDRARAASERASGGAQSPAVQSKAQSNAPRAENAALLKPTDKPIEPSAIPDQGPAVASEKSSSLGHRPPVAAPHRPALAGSAFKDQPLDLKPAAVVSPVKVLPGYDSLPVEAPKEVAIAGQIIVEPVEPGLIHQRFYKGHPIPDEDHMPEGDPEGLTILTCTKCELTCLPAEIEGQAEPVSHCCGAPMVDCFGAPFDPTALAERQDLTINAKRKSTSRGVSYIVKTHRWRANVSVNNITFSLGEYDKETDAAKVYDNAVFYLDAAGLLKGRKLNFPHHYTVKPIPKVWRKTQYTIERIQSLKLFSAAIGASGRVSPKLLEPKHP